VPTLFAFIIGVAMFKRRVGGVYFAIITQAIAAILTILIIGQQGYTGGVNGITDLRTLLGWDIRTDGAKYHPLLRQRLAAARHLFMPRGVRKQGRPHAGRDARQGGPRPLLGLRRRQLQDLRLLPRAAFAGIGGAMFTLQVGFMSPSFVGIVPSIEMVIFCRRRRAAVAARRGLRRAPGELGARRVFSERFPELWLFAMGGLFIAVVMPSRTAWPGSTTRTSSAFLLARPRRVRARQRMPPRWRPAPRRRPSEGQGMTPNPAAPPTFSSRSRGSPCPSTASRRWTT
jgi:urea transport system permease protein